MAKLRRLAWAAAICAQPAIAQPVLDATVGDHAVIQRDRPIRINGTAQPGETVTVALGQARADARADAQGRFSALLPAMAAGGPFVLSAKAASGEAQSHDVMLGDVFLCSGQSNMDLQVTRAQDARSQIEAAADAGLRLMTIPRASAAMVRPALPQAVAWVPADPDSVARFSAACYYMVKDLRRTAKVPIGAIASSWGGSRISTWMGDGALASSGQEDAARLRALYARDPAAAARQFGAAWERWWQSATGDGEKSSPWQPATTLAWKPVTRITYWEDWGVPELADFNGSVWFSKDVTLSAAQARQAGTIELGRIDDADQTWINGTPIGSSGDPDTPRRYPVSAGTLRAGRNVLRVNVTDVWAKGGMLGPADGMAIRLADGSMVPIGSGWSYAVERRRPAGAPRAPWDNLAGAGMIHNAMIAPLGSIGLKGVAWYQGESDVGIAGYATRLGAMMADWRRQFADESLPFAIVQISPFGAISGEPEASDTAALRDEQRIAAERDAHAALVSTIDIGDPLDIHPGEKREVGRRLARAMRSLAYGDGAPASGPRALSAKRRSDGSIVVQFTDVTGALFARSSKQAIGFELCGKGPSSCRYASAQVGKDNVTLTSDGLDADSVRYAWASSPVVNLFDDSGIAPGSFQLPIGHP